jgi:phosphoserine phosphatase
LFTATLIAEEGLYDILDEIAFQFDMDCTAGKLRSYAWIEEDVAAEIHFAPADQFRLADCAELAEGIRDRTVAMAQGGWGRNLQLDVVVQPSQHRAKRLLVADMDSTMITIECIDELADYAGLKSEVAAITERAMRGELEFEAALRARVSLLEGMEAELVDRCLEERARITPGARALVRTMKAKGATCILVSGGFTQFAGAVAESIGFDRVVANMLEIEEGRLTGLAVGQVVSADTKRDVLLTAAEELGLPIEETLAVGDGANDIPMLQAAGLGVAYRAKPAAAAVADARIEHNDLTALLFAQGYPRSEWVLD